MVVHDHDNQYFTTPEFNKLLAEDFAARIKQVNVATKANFDDFVEKTDEKLKTLNKNFTSNKTKNLETEKKLTNLTNSQIQQKLHKFQKKDLIFVRQNVINCYRWLAEFPSFYQYAEFTNARQQ